MKQMRSDRMMAVDAGTRVALRNIVSGELSEFVLIQPGMGADPAAGRISMGCPLAQGILGHRAGETVSVALRSGAVSYEILVVEPMMAG